MVWYFVWYYHNIKYDIVWYGGSATPGYSLSWMTRSEQSCGLPATNLVKLTHLPSPTIVIVAFKVPFCEKHLDLQH